jgi:hypothetical protein
MICSHLLSRHGQLDLVYTNFDMVIDHFTHLVWTVCVGGNTGHEITVPSGNLFAICEVARSWQVARIDSIANDNIKSVFG